MITLILGAGKTDYSSYLQSQNDSLIKLDARRDVHPDIVCQLGEDEIELPDDYVDKVIAHHILEHIGKTGQTDEWFQFWEEIYRVMKGDARIEFVCPHGNSLWAWADPSHVRPLYPQSFLYLAQESYRIKNSAISPFRVNCDFVPSKPFKLLKDGNPEINKFEPFSHFTGELQAIKPLKTWWE